MGQTLKSLNVGALTANALDIATSEGVKPLPGWPDGMFPSAVNAPASLVGNFYERLRYRDANYFEGLPNPLDSLYEKVFFGRVDRLQNIIVPKCGVDIYKQTSLDQNVFVFNFVADAFFDLQRNLKIAGDSGHINRVSSNLFEIQALGGWTPYTRRYSRLLSNCAGAFGNHLNSLDAKKYNAIVNFQDYVTEFKNYLKTGKYVSPVTLSGMTLSPSTSPLLSGLAVEIAQRPYGGDAGTYRDYIRDNNFDYYVKAARKYGFYVDRNAPWRLYADVLSDPMLEYLATYDVMPESFFNTYYDRVYTIEVDLLKENLLAMYNNFALGNDTIFEDIPGTVRCPASTTKIIGKRTESTIEEINQIPLEFILDVYFEAREHDSGVIYKNKPPLVRKAVEVAQVYGIEHAYLYINNLFKPYLYDERTLKKVLTTDTGVVRIGAVEDRQVVSVGISSRRY